MARLVAETDGRLDLARIWRDQAIPPEMQQALLDLARSVQVFITTENQGGNVTEFCKKENSWQHFLKTDVYTDDGFERFKSDALASVPKSATTAKAYALQETMRVVTETPVETWFAIVEWGRSSGKLNSLECTIVTEVAGSLGAGQTITGRQAEKAAKILDTARDALAIPQKTGSAT